MSTAEWQDSLSQVLANTLHAFAPQLKDDALVMLAVDCHPWNGAIYLAALTQSEVDADSSLADPSEMASWKHYDFAESLSEFNVKSLCETMQNDYDSTDDNDTVARTYLSLCAAALADEQITSALRKFQLPDDFRVTVTHPDDGTEYCN